MPFNVHLFVIFLTLNLLGENNELLFESRTKHDFTVLQTLGDRKFQGREVGLKSQPFRMWLKAKLLRHYKFWSG